MKKEGGTMGKIVLTLRDAGRPGDAPLAVRLRMALKRLARSFGLRVVRIQPHPKRSDANGKGTDILATSQPQNGD